MFSKELRHAGHRRLFEVSPLLSSGWEVRVLEDSEVVRRVCYSDWHRVERAINAMEREMSELVAQGWRAIDGPSAPPFQSTNL